jgi:Arc/MetJ-type ribon-helix-helix transcriptional regulator
MTKAKIAITLDVKQLADVRARVRSRRSPSVSAYIAKAVADSLEADSMARIVEDMKRERGEPSPEDREWARALLGL